MNPMQMMGQMMARSNPMMMLMNAVRSGGNPMQLLQQMAGQNPQISQFMQMINGKNPQQLSQMEENLAKERGTSVEQISKHIGFNPPR